MASLRWQTRVGKPKLVCVDGSKTGGKRVCKLLASNRNVFADCFYAAHTHTKLSLPTRVCQLKFACEGRFTHSLPQRFPLAEEKGERKNGNDGLR